MEVVCVTGMHRTGTSLVSRLVNLLGVDLGRDESLLPPAEDNPGGFWENSEIKRVNDRVLHTLGGSWHEPPALPNDWQNDPVLDPARQDAASVLASEARDIEPFGWKDPRTSLTLPFWLTVTRVRSNIVCLRQPSAVAASLAERNGFRSEKSAELWILYTLNAWLSHSDRLLVVYEDVTSQVGEASKRIARHLNLADPDSETLRRVEDVLDPGLDHRSWLQPGSGPLMELAERLMTLLRTADDAAIRPAMEGLEWLTRARRLTDELLVRDPEEASAEAVVQDQLGATKASMRELRRLSAQRVERTEVERRQIARTAMSRLQREERRARAERDERAAELEAAAAERDELRAEREAAQREVANVTTELEDVKKEATEVRERLQDAESRASAAESARNTAEQERVAARRQYERLRGRRSVRFAMRVAQLAKPVFRFIRRVRSRHRSGSGGGNKAEVDRSADNDDRTRDADGRLRASIPSRSPTRRRLGRGHYWAETADRLSELGPITVIIPVYNAPKALRRCVDAVIRNTSRQVELLLIDDCSTESATARVLREVQAVAGVKVLYNEKNQGFTATVNRGLQETTGDVVILNSDTEVPPRWLENLTACAYHDQAVGTVTPLSNNAGAFSAPSIGEDNPLPAWLTFDDLGRRVMRTSARLYPRAPTGNGFCLYIKRELLNQIGYLDSMNFPRGYGEENDFCMRALDAGWENVVDDATFVAHELAASFGEHRTDLMEQGRKIVDTLHPTYSDRVRAFVQSEGMTAVRAAVQSAMEQTDTETPLRVLFVVHSGRGGTPGTNVDLMDSLQRDVECFVLESDTKTLRLGQASGRELIAVDTEQLEPPLRFGEVSRDDYRRFVASILVEYNIELVHVRHLVKHTLDVPDLARAFDIPVVVSLHDYYLACPTVHLLDEKDQFCGGKCTEGAGSCRVPMEWIARDVPPLKHEWVYEWRSRVWPLLSQADALVTTTTSAKNVYLEAYPELARQRWEIIEHGRDLEQWYGLWTTPEPDGVIRLLLPGNLDAHKGSEFVKQLKNCDDSGRLELRFLGDIPDDLELIGTNHGPYERDEFAQKVEEIKPNLVGLFSVWAETYMHILTESWGAGLPVIATDIGALGERIRSHGGGWVVAPDDPRDAYGRLLEIADNPSTYEQGLRGASVVGLPGSERMGEEYLKLYRSVLRRRQKFVSSCSPGLWGERELKARIAVVGADGRHPGSAYVRALRRFSHPDVRRHMDVRVGGMNDALEDLGGCDVVFIERTAVPPERSREMVERAHEAQTPLVLDLDDNLLSEDALRKAGRHEWLEVAESLRFLAAKAALVTVSTEAIADVARCYSSRVVVVPNMIDERLWFAPREEDRIQQARRQSGGGLQILYMGTSTHERDLAFFRPIMERIWSEIDHNASLNVIGGEPDGKRKGWYSRIDVPKGRNTYPAFVRWLRSMKGRWDLSIAPLAQTDFNIYKSDLKFLEYSALGLPGVYSNSPAYCDSVVHGQTGALAGDDTESWLRAIGWLANDFQLRRNIMTNATSYVCNYRCIRTEKGRFTDIIAKALHT